MAYLPSNFERTPSCASAGIFARLDETSPRCWTEARFRDAAKHGWYVYAGQSARFFTIRAVARYPDAKARAQAAKDAFQNTPDASPAKQWVIIYARLFMTQEARKKIGLRLKPLIKPKWMSEGEYEQMAEADAQRENPPFTLFPKPRWD